MQKKIAYKLMTALALVATYFVTTASVWYAHQGDTPEELLK